MTYPFDTTTTDDLTDAQIQAAIDRIDTAWTVFDVRYAPNNSTAKAIIALARLMRDHPELFEEPVDPLEDEARKIAEEWGFTSNGTAYDACLDALKRGMELAKPTEPEWIEWHGGECPVPAGSDCEVRFRDGETRRDTEPEEWQWRHIQHAHDIVAYRVWP